MTCGPETNSTGLCMPYTFCRHRKPSSRRRLCTARAAATAHADSDALPSAPTSAWGIHHTTPGAASARRSTNDALRHTSGGAQDRAMWRSQLAASHKVVEAERYFEALRSQLREEAALDHNASSSRGSFAASLMEASFTARYPRHQ